MNYLEISEVHVSAIYFDIWLLFILVILFTASLIYWSDRCWCWVRLGNPGDLCLIGGNSIKMGCAVGPIGE